MHKYINLIVILAVVAPINARADTATLNPTDDASIAQGYPDTNYGSDGSLNVGYHSSFGWGNVLIKFDLSSYAGATVTSANLRLYVYELLGDIPAGGIYNARNVADWDEGSVTWNNSPGLTDDTPVSAPSTSGWWVNDVTSWVQAYVNGTYDNYGFQIFKDDMDWATFHMRSKEYSSNHPELVLDYTPNTAVESATLGNIKATFK